VVVVGLLPGVVVVAVVIVSAGAFAVGALGVELDEPVVFDELDWLGVHAGDVRTMVT
jgi:hypothetical protein